VADLSGISRQTKSKKRTVLKRKTIGVAPKAFAHVGTPGGITTKLAADIKNIKIKNSARLTEVIKIAMYPDIFTENLFLY